MTVLQGNGPNGTLATLYFDDASGLLVRMVRHGRSPIGRVPTQVDYCRLPRRRRHEVSVPLDVRVAGRPRQLRVQRCEGECPDRRRNIRRTERQPVAARAKAVRALDIDTRLLSVARRRAFCAHRRPRRTTDAAFSSFFQARTAPEAAAAADRIVASGVGFDEAFARLRQGRVYSRDVASRRRAGELSQRGR